MKDSRLAPITVAREVILALLDARDFSAYQLTHANGGMTDEELEEITSQYLHRVSWEDPALRDRVQVLRELIGDRLDADVLSTVFRCSAEQAARVLTA